MVDMALKLDKKPAYPYGCLCGGGGSPRCHRARNPVDQKTQQSKTKEYQRQSTTIEGQADQREISCVSHLLYV